ncbi:MAG TPA: hypothetical protein VEE85_02105 [Candidatus Bathyarchaeia archaeon]|nr:hypothetical protein [Candidatus Bathyarchaeia archaeon]
MKKLTGWLLLVWLLLAVLGTAVAQEMHGPPKVLVVFREVLKPGKSGMTHEKSESAFVQAFAKAKWPTHYFAADSLSGHPRSLFFVGYDSFEAWEKDSLATQKNPQLAAALDHAGVVDGELLSESEGIVLAFNEKYSLNPNVDIAHMRYFEIGVYHVKPGHHQEWEEAVKLVKAAYEKIPDVHWAAFESVFGGDDETYAIFTPRKSLAEIDKGFAQGKEFAANMGEEGMKKLHELEASAIVSTSSQLFQFNPRESYPPEEWVKADPDFWKSKPAMAEPKKPEKHVVQ